MKPIICCPGWLEGDPIHAQPTYKLPDGSFVEAHDAALVYGDEWRQASLKALFSHGTCPECAAVMSKICKERKTDE